MTSTHPDTTSGIPTAKGYLPPGTPAQICIDHNRACKVARIVTTANGQYDDTITDAQIDLMADLAGVNRPGSDDTREAVRAGLGDPYTNNDSGEDIAQAVLDAAHGEPFPFRTNDGRTVLLIALPLGE